MSETGSDTEESSLLQQFNENVQLDQLIETIDYDHLCQDNGLQEIFSQILNKSGPIQSNDWFILDNFGTALARRLPCCSQLSRAMHIADILSILNKKFDRKWHKWYKTIATNFYLIGVGVKSGFLWDIGPTPHLNQLQQLIDELNYANCLSEKLRLIQIDTDICVLNLNSCCLSNDKQIDDIIFVDVTKSLDTPKLIPRPISKYSSMIWDMILGVQRQLNEFSVSDCDFLNIRLEHDFCVPSLFGILIGFPIVYWYNPLISHENCLNDMELNVVQAFYNDILIYSFSYPEYALKDEEKDMIENWKIKMKTFEFQIKTIKSSIADKLLEAQRFFEEILKSNPNFLKSYQNLDNVKNQLVERWHFRMLNDHLRNTSFKNAITSSIENGCKTILDIGTGTGLLSLYAIKAISGAPSGHSVKIIACDDSKVMINIARDVLKANQTENHVELMNRYSHDLTETDLGGRVDLVVTETLDSGVFGEGILQTLIHAKEHLLNPINGKIIPARVKLFIAGFESKTIASENVCTNTSFADLIYLKNHRLVAKCTEPYDTENIRQIKDFKIITSIQKAFECNFNDLDEMKKCFDGTTEKKVRLEYERTGFLDGFVVWFVLSLDDNNFIESKPSVNSCWDQTIFRLNHRFANMEKLKYLNVTVSCKHGILNLNHYYNFTGKIFSVNQDVIKFINDTVYINKLEFDFFSTMKGRHSKKYENVLDFSPFPYIGISLMKEKRTRKLYCSKESQDFICFVAFCNCLQYENIVFINEPIEVLFIGEKFDLIILSPIDTLGCVNSSQISNYNILKTNNLKPNGCIIPHKIELWAELIASEWLTRVSKVINPELIDFHIDQLMNRFSTTNQLNLLSFDHIILSNPFQVSEVYLDDRFYEKLIKLKTKSSDQSANGILYFYKIYVAEATEPISTKRNCSFIRRACFVIDDFKCENFKATVHFVQNHGVIKCCLR